MDFKDAIRIEYEFVKGYHERILQGLNREEFIWQPAPHGKSIAMIFFHEARWMDQYLNSRLLKAPEIWETLGWYRKLNLPLGEPVVDVLETLEQMAEFRAPPVASLKAYWDAACGDILKYMDSKQAEDFDRKIDYPLGHHPTLGDLFATGVAHLNFHVGQMLYLLSLQRGGTDICNVTVRETPR